MDKTRPIVVADTGPIIHLDEMECLDLLADFNKIFVPEAVWREVLRHRPQATESQTNLFVRHGALNSSPLVKALTPLYTLHAGSRRPCIYVLNSATVCC